MKGDKYHKMLISLRIEILNGTGGLFVEPAFEKEFMKSLINETNGAIQPLYKEYPHYLKSYPDNGYITYYYDVQTLVEVNITQLVRDNAGCYFFIAKKMVGSDKVRQMIEDNLRDSIGKKLNLKYVNTALYEKKYYK